ncbi:MAG: Fructose-bisphosphate aldolase class-II [Microgenomates bacterium OLB23]|nr:MAG: Fructose-bisphosphate aldolase class-II [Microgenomates bacterium OLB23]
MFGDLTEQAWAIWLIRELAAIMGVYPASTHNLYQAMASGEISQRFTLPAMNLRTLTFDLACAAFRQAKLRNAGAMIFEIARSEIGYTNQRPDQYAAMVFAAAIATGWEGPVFIQGDHFQAGQRNFAADQAAEMNAIEQLILSAIRAGMWNIDVDMSTLVRLGARTLRQEQQPNGEFTARMLRFIRQYQPEGVTVSVGGEIGEVGGRNSTRHDFNAFMYTMQLYDWDELAKRGQGLCRISVQTGTAHGGKVQNDGSLQDVNLDFNVLRTIGRAAARHKMVVVQHGASTLPVEMFQHITQAGASECHLATAFQRTVLDVTPDHVVSAMKAWLLDNKGGPSGTTSEEKWWKDNAKHALGPFATELWGMPDYVLRRAVGGVEEKMSTIFDAFNIANTLPLVCQWAPLTYTVPNPRPDEVASP